MIKYNVPADFKLETLREYNELNHFFKDSNIYETYGQISINNPVGSGRANDLLPRVDENILADYIENSKLLGIKFNYTLNTTCMSNKEFSQNGLEEIYAFLKKLKRLGVESITIAMPSLIEFVKNSDLNFEIKASTICMVNSPNKAVIYENQGVDQIVLDESINRDFATLKLIRNAVSIELELIANVICHQDCIYEMFHHNQKSHDYQANKENKSATYYSHRCIIERMRNPENILKLGWIRPEDIKYYYQIGYKNFKLQGRQAVMKGDIVRTVKAYLEQKYDGDFMSLLDMFSPTNSFHIEIDNKKLDNYIQPFLKSDYFCKNNCKQCSYCKNYMSKYFDIEEINRIYDIANRFYNEYDEYKSLCKLVSNNKEDSVFKEEFDI